MAYYSSGCCFYVSQHEIEIIDSLLGALFTLGVSDPHLCVREIALTELAAGGTRSGFLRLRHLEHCECLLKTQRVVMISTYWTLKAPEIRTMFSQTVK